MPSNQSLYTIYGRRRTMGTIRSSVFLVHKELWVKESPDIVSDAASIIGYQH